MRENTDQSKYGYLSRTVAPQENRKLNPLESVAAHESCIMGNIT